MSHLPAKTALTSTFVAWAALSPVVALAENACTVRSGASVPPVVELYTSEGCSSCPPADRWLSTLKRDAAIVALAFHVDYWDRLGWKDRFASPTFTQRQANEQARNGADFSYTPQIVLDGQDHKGWRSDRSPSSKAARPAAWVDVVVTRTEESYFATIVSQRPQQLAAFWAVTENDHASVIKAGENEGVTLQHDYVVRQYAPIAAWQAAQPRTLAFKPSRGIDPAHPRSVNLVVFDPRNGQPLQAVKVGC
jgi:hypothetical protein